MTEGKELGDQLVNYVTSSWITAGYVATFFICIIITRNVLRKQGFITIGDILLGGVCMGLCVFGGYLSLVFLGFLLKEHFEGFFKQLVAVKIFQTTEYKTKNLLYKGEEDDE